MTDEELTWWVIDSASLLEAFRRVRDGEDPDLLYAELYANSAVDLEDEEL